jgi:hypothetical protein
VNCCNHRYQKQAKAADRLGPKGAGLGCLTSCLRHADIDTPGGKTGPNLLVLFAWNTVSPYYCPLGRLTARKAVGSTGIGS